MIYFKLVALLVLSVSVQEIYAKRVALLIGNANNVNQNTMPVQQDAELIFWDSIKNETDAESYQAYLQQYPNGKFKVLAETRIKKYTVKPSQTVVQQPASVV